MASQSIDGSAVRFYEGGSPITIANETSVSFDLTGHLADTSGKNQAFDTNKAVGYGASFTGSGEYVAGDAGAIAIRAAIIALTNSTACQIKTINSQVWTFTANFSSFGITAANKDTVTLAWAGTVDSAVTFV